MQSLSRPQVNATHFVLTIRKGGRRSATGKNAQDAQTAARLTFAHLFAKQVTKAGTHFAIGRNVQDAKTVPQN